MKEDEIADLAVNALEDLKGVDITRIDVRGITTIADWMIIASGTSDRHVKSLAERVQRNAKDVGLDVIGVEGELEGEWVLVDLGAVIVHVMQPRSREFYALEKLWRMDPGQGARA